MKNKLLTAIQIALVLAWVLLTWKVEPVAWKIPTGFITIDQIWGLGIAILTLVPAISLQKFKTQISQN